jgi:hypothetical protein
MNTNNVLVAHPKDKAQTNALKAFMEALQIKFEVEQPYNKAFVDKIKKSKKQVQEGKYITLTKKQINAYLDLK